MVVAGFELGGRDHVDLPVERSLVESVHVLGVLDGRRVPPRVRGGESLVEPGERFGQGVVLAVSVGAKGHRHAGVSASLRVVDRQVLGGFNRSSQHRTGRGCDDYAEAAFGGDRTSHTALARPTLGWAA